MGGGVQRNLQKSTLVTHAANYSEISFHIYQTLGSCHIPDNSSDKRSWNLTALLAFTLPFTVILIKKHTWIKLNSIIIREIRGLDYLTPSSRVLLEKPTGPHPQPYLSSPKCGMEEHSHTICWRFNVDSGQDVSCGLLGMIMSCRCYQHCRRSNCIHLHNMEAASSSSVLVTNPWTTPCHGL